MTLIRSIFPCRTSFMATRAGFPESFSTCSTRGLQPACSCLARAPDTTTNSNLFTSFFLPVYS